jgi:ubiquinone/menaquinone biosynthesis C-methylase UbiE
MKHHGLRLLPLEALVKTGPVDHADWNFRPVLGWIQRLRFKMILKMLPRQEVGRLLEVGYGSGVLMPELAERCEELYGVDIHPMHQEVSDRLKQFHIKAHLFSTGAEALPFDDQFFDGVIAVSALEFVEQLEAACQEIQRVLKPDGFLILVTPGHSRLVDLGLKILTRKSAKTDYEGRRQQLIPVLMRYFSIKHKRTFPPIGGSFLCLYTALKLIPIGGKVR